MDFKLIIRLVIGLGVGGWVMVNLVFNNIGVVVWTDRKVRVWGRGGNFLILQKLDNRQNRLVWMGINGFDVLFRPEMVVLKDEPVDWGKVVNRGMRVKVMEWRKLTGSRGFAGDWQVEKLEDNAGRLRLGKWVVKWGWGKECLKLRLVWQDCSRQSGFRVMVLGRRWGIGVK